MIIGTMHAAPPGTTCVGRGDTVVLWQGQIALNVVMRRHPDSDLVVLRQDESCRSGYAAVFRRRVGIRRDVVSPMV